MSLVNKTKSGIAKSGSSHNQLKLLSVVVVVSVEPVAPGAAPAIFGNLKIDNTFITVWDSAQTYIRMTFPNTADTLVGRATTDTLTNKTLTSPTIGGTSVVANRASGNTTLVGGGAVTVLVTHGLSSTPTRVWLQERTVLGTATSNVTYNFVFPGSLGASTFAVNALSSANNTTIIDWLAIISDE